MNNLKSIIISSNCSSGGKTTITLALMNALTKKGFNVQGYKVGPDYIDTAFHTEITGVESRNLDLYLMGEKGVKAAYERGSGDYGVIEGVMGLYDGKGIDSAYSTASISRILNIPIILVITPKAQSTTLCAEINGMVDFEDVDIVGIIFNNVNESYYRLLKAAIEKNCSPKIRVFGYLPHNEQLEIGSRHLGLIQSYEIEDLKHKIDVASELICRYVDMEMLLKYFKEANLRACDDFHIENNKIVSAVAMDRAFSFYYRENIELLKEAGEVIYFSPLSDPKLPQNIDFLYIGGGYPEMFLEELSNNRTMLMSIRKALEEGLRCYAECGGLMYLTENICGKDTVGFFNGSAVMTDVLQNFGYAELEVVERNSIIPAGLKVNCHEFHKSKVKINDKDIIKLSCRKYDGSIKKWTCGHAKNKTFASYAHVHFFNNINMLLYLCGNLRNSNQ